MMNYFFNAPVMPVCAIRSISVNRVYCWALNFGFIVKGLWRVWESFGPVAFHCSKRLCIHWVCPLVCLAVLYFCGVVTEISLLTCI